MGLATKPLPTTSEWLRANLTGRPIGVDREAKVIRGMVLAEKGPFKTPGRGEFDDLSLDKIVELMAEHPNGLKSRLAHPTLSNDGVGKFLGRARDGWRDGNKIRGDLHFDPSSFKTPNGDLGNYVMDLAESDPDALSTSLVLQSAKEHRLTKEGTKQTDDKGDPLPPLWRPTKLHATDVVDTGDAVNGMLSVDGLPDEWVRRGTELLDNAFEGQTREVVEARAMAWLKNYLAYRFGEGADSLMTDREDIAAMLLTARAHDRRLHLLEKTIDILLRRS